MTRLLRSTLLALTVVAGPVAAQEDQPVVVELFTSQGCSSCPPADALLAEIAQHEGVLPLSLHVDYWDYIGWEDTFGDPRFTARQKRYAKTAGERMIYTPQVVVGGRDRMVGSKAMDVVSAVQAHRGAPQPVRVEAQVVGDTLDIRAVRQGGGPLRPMQVHLVPFSPSETTAIRGGENAGVVVTSVNVVRDWSVLGDWNGSGEWSGSVPLDQVALPAAVLVQEAGPGAILGAAVAR